jgi:glucose-1-phosphate thymidylyltransferase
MDQYKGIVLAGGTGSRLYPITLGISKHLLPIYDKPMIYYPLSVLMLSGIQDILIITTEVDLICYQKLLGDGSQFGLRLEYEIQQAPEGIAQTFIIAEAFIGESNVCLILGDNVFYGQDFSPKLLHAINRTQGSTVFGYHVRDPSRYGVVEFDKLGQVLSIEEKPRAPKSNYAVTGLYFFDNQVIEIAKTIQPSARGELEITDVISAYLEKDQLSIEILGRGFAWLDTGTHDSLIEAGQFVQTIEMRQGLKVACLEEIAYHQGWLSKENFRIRASQLANTGYGKYLKSLIEG